MSRVLGRLIILSAAPLLCDAFSYGSVANLPLALKHRTYPLNYSPVQGAMRSGFLVHCLAQRRIRGGGWGQKCNVPGAHRDYQKAQAPDATLMESMHYRRLAWKLAAFSAMAIPTAAVATKGNAAIAMGTSLVPATDLWSLWTLLLICSALGLRAEKTKLGAALSSPLVTMLLSLILVNIGVLPVEAPIYNSINKFLVPMAVPLLLFTADLRRVIKDTGTLFVAFCIGAVATLTSTAIAAWMIPMHSVDGAWKVAAALCSRHIGGAINYVAVCDVLATPAATVTAGIAADNLVVALYFMLLFALANKSGAVEGSVEGVAIEEEGAESFSIQEMSSALAVSATICWTATQICAAAGITGWSIPIATLITILAATAFPGQLSSLKGAGEAAGVMFMQLFFAATGASGSIRMVIATAPVIVWFSFVHLAIHIAILLGLGRVVFPLIQRSRNSGTKAGFSESFWWNELLLASNANVGGPTTAAGMAAAKKWRALVVPALLVGVFGYAIATFLSILLGRFVLVPLMAP